METWEQDLKANIISKSIAIGSGFDQPIEEVIKARSGTYKNTPQNRKQGRAGERYGAAIHGGQTAPLDEETKRNIDMATRWANTCIAKSGVNKDDYTVTTDGKLVAIQNKKTKALGHFTHESISTEKAKTWLKEDAEKGKTSHEKWKDAQADDARITHGELIKEGKEKARNFKEESSKTRTDSHFKEAFDSYAPKKKAVENTLQKAFEADLISKEVLEKARAGIYAPTSQNKKKGVVGQKYGAEKKQEEPGKKESGQETFSEDELKEHAKNASEQALTNAIKQSPEPVVRQVAHAELQRRSKEEKPGDEKDSFPGKKTTITDKNGVKSKWEDVPGDKDHAKEVFDEAKKKKEDLKKKHDLLAKHRNELDEHERKKGENWMHQSRDAETIRAKQLKERKEVLTDSDKLKKVEEQHKKEWDTHLEKHDTIHNKWKEEHKQLLEKHKTEKEGLNPKKEEQEVKKAITGIQYF
jgi:hypothetical protein